MISSLSFLVCCLTTKVPNDCCASLIPDAGLNSGGNDVTCSGVSSLAKSLPLDHSDWLRAVI